MVRKQRDALFFAFAFMLLAGARPCLAKWNETGSQPESTSTGEVSPKDSTPATEEDGNSHRLTGSKTPSTGMTEGQRELYLRMGNSGRSMYQIGRVLAWGGLGASIVGNLMQQPAVAGFGSLAVTIGIPVMGVGAGKAERSSLILVPEGNTYGKTGWPVYWTGWGLQGAGIVLIVVGITSNIETDEYGDERISDDAAGPMIAGFISIISGAICHYVAWYQFSERLDQSEVNMAGLSFAPTLRMHEGQLDGGGLKLALDF